MIPGVDARDRILPAFGYPRRAVGSDNDTMGRRALAEIDEFGRAVSRIEPPQCAVALAGEPDRAIGGGRDVMRASGGGDRIIFDPERAFLRAGATQQSGVTSIPAAVEARNWRRFIALPRLSEKKAWTRRSTFEEHNPTVWWRQGRGDG
jgi:hypothetical protein